MHANQEAFTPGHAFCGMPSARECDSDAYFAVQGTGFLVKSDFTQGIPCSVDFMLVRVSCVVGIRNVLWDSAEPVCITVDAFDRTFDFVP